MNDPRILWFRRLKRLLREMPKDVELQVHQNTIQMNEAGARDAAFDAVGNADNVDCLDDFRTERIYPCSESI